MDPAATRHAAVLFADIAGSTRLYETLGDQMALAMIARCLDMMRTACGEHDGHVVKTIGDEVMATFDSAANAGYAATDMHKRVVKLADGHKARATLRIHAGFHHGAVLVDQNDVFGDTVNVAARLCSLAKGGQTLIAAATLEHLPDALRVRTRNQDLQAIKGKEGDVEVYELLWQDSEDDLTTMVPRSAGRHARLTLRCGDREVDLANASVLTFGRDGQNDFVILDRKASRLHARIERRRDKYVLIDHSTNGTFCVQGEREIELRREELLLRGRGRIVFGHSVHEAGTDIVEFDTGHPA
ncbi:MAG TPA: adenylate/guanylate cyclase domain-containing protein [Casimicrobiaceae bacterium]|nr:adenylate/guanylate cyclase domain-containing protein [Casimicrobiaceae bacterium]